MNKSLIPAFLLTFVNVLGFSILMPILPFVVEHYGAPKWVFGLVLGFENLFCLMFLTFEQAMKLQGTVQDIVRSK